jgi:hypothetical protein
VTLTDRDRRIVLILLPVVVLIAYWFLLLGPKRDDLKTARDEQHAAEQARDQAVAQANQLEKARESFAADYAAVVRLGKAIPEQVDAPSLLVQLDRASHGTHIDFDSVTFGARGTAALPTVTTTQAPAQPGGNAAAGGAPAATGLGRATEAAGNTVTQANQAGQAAGGTTTTDTTATTTATTTDTTATATPATTDSALDSVALTFNFRGTYFDLADFFHRLKRFVYVANSQVFVRGRLLTIDTLTFAPGGGTTNGTTSSGDLTATMGATIYLSPKGQGTTGGATAAGPAGADTTTTPAPSGAQTSKVPLATAGVR